MQADLDKIHYLASDLVGLLNSPFATWCPCFIEFTEVLLVFICCHTDRMAELGWGDDIAGILLNADRSRAKVHVEDWSGMSKIFAALVQAGLVSAAAIEGILQWASQIGPENDVQFHIKISTVASVLAMSPADLDPEVMDKWVWLISKGDFSTKYYRMLLVIALTQVSTLNEELRAGLAHIISALMTNQIPSDSDFQCAYAFLFRYPALMPIESLGRAQFPDFVEGEDKL
jgi:hypothetical protein